MKETTGFFYGKCLSLFLAAQLFGLFTSSSVVYANSDNIKYFPPRSHWLSVTNKAIGAFAQIQNQPVDRVQHTSLDNFTLTAYSLDRRSTGKAPGSKGFGITASGTHARVGRTVAVDPGVIPIGSLLYIRGIGWRVAEDSGGAVKGRHIDVLLASQGQAIQFGVRRHISVFLYD
ncbi:3D domain-containing protein [Alicyclobacillus sp. SO9]|uniref:3D domain-containing protein n=1 Tax=Alicyclobacillus sp. SO9 TaxID=2665646 RepID=UPI0018E80759|nr:3D domain-containing protein [Alicyclobacillus sp. SO9]QQE80386.1 3D domain-containing protein [Alicyclobacillus sp. SO9]